MFCRAEKKKTDLTKKEQEYANFLRTVCTMVADHKTHVQVSFWYLTHMKNCVSVITSIHMAVNPLGSPWAKIQCVLFTLGVCEQDLSFAH